MKSIFFTGVFYFILSGLSVAPVHAAENLTFNNNVSRSSLEKIKSFKGSADFEVVKTDLNGDGLQEFVTRNSGCAPHTSCDYSILAEQDDKIISLGRMNAANILLGNETTHGVRNLLVFDNAGNDFDYTLYTWHPESSAYEKVKP